MSKAKAKGKRNYPAQNKSKKSGGRRALIAVCIVLAVLIVGVGAFIGFRGLWQKPKAHEHVYTGGICDICKEPCLHEKYENGSCIVCGTACTHEYEEGSHVCIICGSIGGHTYTDGVCNVCGEKCNHEEYKDGACTECGKACVHEYETGSHVCTICGAVSAHEYAAGEHDCSICGKGVNHFYEVGSHNCVVCGEVSAHEYEEGSHVCQICSEVSAHDWKKGVCTICAVQCVHENENDVCKICGMSLLEFTVTFQTNGGTEIASVTVTDSFTVAQPQAPEKADYHFGGWYTNENCTTPYDFTAEVKADTTLYAKWVPIVYQTVTLVLNSGTITFDDGEPQTDKASVRVENGTMLQIDAEPIRTGYTFKGWYKNSSCTTAYDFENPVTGDITLYALWSPTYYTITFDSQEAGIEVPTRSIRHNRTITGVPSVNWEGHPFCGWYSREVAAEGVTPSEDQFLKTVDGVVYLYTKYNFKTLVTEEFTLYARWHIYDEGSHVCNSCGEVSDHSFVDGVCTVCGNCEHHNYVNGVCSVCSKHEVVYSGIGADFLQAYSAMFQTSINQGESVSFDFGAGLTVTSEDGVKYTFVPSSVNVTRHDSTTSSEETIETMSTGSVWTFTVPEAEGTITVTLSGTLTRELPEGYHTITYEIDTQGLTTSEGNYFVTGKDYAKAGQVVMLRLDWSSNPTGSPTVPTVSTVEFVNPTGISDYYAFIEETSGAVVLFFTVTGDASFKISIA